MTMGAALLCCVVAFASIVAATTPASDLPATGSSQPSSPPNVVMIVVDDFGFADAGFRNGNQTHTPTMDALAANGVVLESYYLQPSCSPTRACLQSGRWPLHTGINNFLPGTAAYGLPLAETTIAQLFKSEGYATAAVGKWHLGFHKTSFTPTFRGYDSFYGYYEGSEDYFKHSTSLGFDFHDEPRPECGPGCTTRPWNDVGNYSTNLFAGRAVDIVSKHNVDTPLFMYLAFQGVHSPRQAPESYWGPYNATIQDPGRKVFAGMVSAVDEGIKNVTAALKARGMYDNTIIVLTTDNGGPTHECAAIGANNSPLRGGKCSIWEGGTRGTGIAFAPWFPVKGLSWHGLMHAVDWLPSLIVGAVRKGKPLPANSTLPLDGINVWEAMLSNGTSPRTELYYGLTDSSVGIHGPAYRTADGWKLIPGGGGGTGDWLPIPNGDLEFSQASTCTFDVVTGLCLANDYFTTINTNSTAACCAACTASANCTAFTLNTDEGLCYLKSDLGLPRDGKCVSGMRSTHLLFNVLDDPTEHNNETNRPDIAMQLASRIAELEATGVPQGKDDPSCPPFKAGQDPEGSWVGPWCD